MKFKKLFCRHKWEYISKPYLFDIGRTKRADVKCVKCGKKTNKDIFDIKSKNLSSRTYCWCPNCNHDLVGNKSFIDDEDYIYFKCKNCGHESAWDFDLPCPEPVEQD